MSRVVETRVENRTGVIKFVFAAILLNIVNSDVVVPRGCEKILVRRVAEFHRGNPVRGTVLQSDLVLGGLAGHRGPGKSERVNEVNSSLRTSVPSGNL